MLGLLGPGKPGHVQQVVQARGADGLVDGLAGVDDLHDLLRPQPLPDYQQLPQAGGGDIHHIPEVEQNFLDGVVIQRLGFFVENGTGVRVNPPLDGNDALALVLLNVKYHDAPPFWQLNLLSHFILSSI